MFSSKFIVKILLVLLIIGVIGGCAMFQDFLAPSDLVAGVEAQYGIRISDARVSKSVVRNTGSDEFSIECDISSKPSIKSVTVDLSAIGEYSDTYLRADVGNQNHWKVSNINIAENYTKVSYTFTITAVNNENYSNTASVTISVLDISNYFVSADGDDDANDGSKNKPFATIQKAIDEAVIYGIRKVYVSKGTYTNQTNGYCVELKNGVAIYGGYNTNFSVRNIANNPTIIDGKQTAQHVVIAENVRNTASGLDGFVITSGNSINKGGGGIFFKASYTFVQNCIISNNSADIGGGIMEVACENGFVSNNIFVNNTAKNGGALAFNLSSSIISGNIFSNNIATNGAAIMLNSYSEPIISYNTIVSNKASGSADGTGFGGGMYIDSSSPVVNNNIISYNKAFGSVDGVGFGGGMYLNNSLPVINNNIITYNIATNGGGIYFNNCLSADVMSNTISYNTANGNSSSKGGGGMFFDSSSPTLTGNTISSNYAEYSGGGMYLNNYSSPTLTDNTISSNYARYGDGGGMYLNISSPTMNSNTISHNYAEGNGAKGGGGMYMNNSSPTMIANTINSNSTLYNGGGMRLDSSSPMMINNTISKNSGHYGGGMYLNSSSSPMMTDNTISYNSANQHGGGMYLNSSSSPMMTDNTINYNSAIHSGGGVYLEKSSPTITGNIISYNSASVNGGAMLMTGSPSSPTNIQNLILDNWSVNSNVIFIINADAKPVFISNIIGSTNGDTAHYAMWEFNAITGHTLQYNFFVTNAMGFLYRDYNGTSVVTNGVDWANINIPAPWTDALPGSTNNTVIDYDGAMTMWGT